MKNSDKFLNMMQDLIEEVERQAGTHLPERCVSRTYKIVVRDHLNEEAIKEVNVPGCGNESIFMVRYHPEAEAKIFSYDKDAKHGVGKEIVHKGDKGEGLTRVCAVEDMMDRWPRFEHAIGRD